MRERISKLPVRWRLTLASAALTAVILVTFAAAVGRLAEERLQSDFDSELRAAAGAVASRVKVSDISDFGQLSVQGASDLEDYARAGDAHIRIVTAAGGVIAQTRGAPDLGLPREGVSETGDLHVAAELVSGSEEAPVAAFVQYARGTSQVQRTTGRVWLFLALGVLGGTGLAGLAGFTLARRAMEPIARLTSTAREIADTRDPSRRLPQPESEDEVAELARTLQEMLESLDAARGETEEAMRRQRSFVADASHELRTPLTSVLANLELLEQATTRDEDREVVESALRSSRRMKRIVADLLLLARADAGRTGLRRPLDLGRIVREVCQEASPVLGRRDLDVDAPEPLPVEGDPDELHRLVLNLVENTAKHTPEGTKVRVRAARADGDALVVVEDDGPGIEPEISANLFDRFVSAQGDAGGGSGLGLAIVAAVARSHGGSVSVGESQAGGARFEVRIPISKIEVLEVL